jgi:hypothetical protein
MLGITFRLTSTSHPEPNIVERHIQTLNKIIASFCHDNTLSWLKHIYAAQSIINNTWNSSIQATPSEIMYGFKAENILDRLVDIPDSATLLRDKKLLEQKLTKLKENIEKARTIHKGGYDKKHQDKQFKIGEIVCFLLRREAKSGINLRFTLRYSYPWRIVEKKGDLTYILEYAGEKVYDKRRMESKQMIIHVSKLRHLHQVVNEE